MFHCNIIQRRRVSNSIRNDSFAMKADRKEEEITGKNVNLMEKM